MKEEKTILAVKVNHAVAERVKHYCRERGLKYGFFVEKAILEQLAREELKEDLARVGTTSRFPRRVPKEAPCMNFSSSPRRKRTSIIWRLQSLLVSSRKSAPCQKTRVRPAVLS
jgi:hypothetical protein